MNQSMAGTKLLVANKPTQAFFAKPSRLSPGEHSCQLFSFVACPYYPPQANTKLRCRNTSEKVNEHRLSHERQGQVFYTPVIAFSSSFDFKVGPGTQAYYSRPSKEQIVFLSVWITPSRRGVCFHHCSVLGYVVHCSVASRSATDGCERLRDGTFHASY